MTAFVSIKPFDPAAADDAPERLAHLAAIEALDPAGLSAGARFERDLEIHNLRREIFDADVIRTWERRSTALDTVGDGLFLSFARDFAPLPDRLVALSGRLEAMARFLDDHRTRATGPQVRLWQQLEIEAAADLPSFIDEIVAAGDDALDDSGQRRLRAAAITARAAIADGGPGRAAERETGYGLRGGLPARFAGRACRPVISRPPVPGCGQRRPGGGWRSGGTMWSVRQGWAGCPIRRPAR